MTTRRSLPRVGAAALLAALIGCGRDSRPDVLLIVLDTVRADHLSVYGYARPTTPAIDALARDSVVYRNAFAASTWTPPSHASLFTGLMPSTHRVNYLNGTVGGGVVSLNGSVETLAERLAHAGYRTAAFVGNGAYLDPMIGLARGFERYRYRGLEKAGRLAGAVVPWLARRRGRSVFLFLNVIDAHEPYEPPPPYDRLFPGRLDRAVPKHPQNPQTGGRPLDRDEIAHYVSQYDGEIRYADDAVGAIVRELKRLDRYDNALIVVTADHGELFGEHERIGHGGDPIYPLVHVPLIVKYPGRARLGFDDDPASLADIPATILAALGLPLLPSSAQALWERRNFVVSEYVLTDRVSRAAYDGDGHELIEIVENGRRQTRLYDLRRDPAEEHPIDSSTDAAGAQLDEALRRMEAALPPPVPGPVVFPAADASLAERLRRLGYVQ